MPDQDTRSPRVSGRIPDACLPRHVLRLQVVRDAGSGLGNWSRNVRFFQNCGWAGPDAMVCHISSETDHRLLTSLTGWKAGPTLWKAGLTDAQLESRSHTLESRPNRCSAGKPLPQRGLAMGSNPCTCAETRRNLH